MNSSNTSGQALPIEAAPDPSKAVSRLSLLMAVVTSQAYLVHAIFFAHALTPISVHIVDRQTHLALLPGQVGSLEAVFHWDGLIPTMLIAVLVFAVGWMAVRGTAKLLGAMELRTYASRLSPAIAVSEIATVSTGGTT
jgi:hypothetical protein